MSRCHLKAFCVDCHAEINEQFSYFSINMLIEKFHFIKCPSCGSNNYRPTQLIGGDMQQIHKIEDFLKTCSSVWSKYLPWTQGVKSSNPST